MVVHDEGDALAIKGLVRKARRANTAGSAFGLGRMNLPARLIVDDPVSRVSGQSYFIQLADLAASAFRTQYPPRPDRASVCPRGMWDQLAVARFAQANLLATSVLARLDAPGIVVWPNAQRWPRRTSQRPLHHDRLDAVPVRGNHRAAAGKE
jgi:hypothetical protein